MLFITTANDTARIPHALRDRLEIIVLSGYIEDEKVDIAETHLAGAENRAAGLAATPVRFTPDAFRRIIRDYTSERGVRQLGRCLKKICRKVALGLETGDTALVRMRITAAQVPTYLGEPGVGHTDGLDPSASSSTYSPCRKPCASGGGRSWRGWTGWRPPTPIMRAGASTCSAC